MRIFYKEKLPKGKRKIYFCGFKILSYTKKDKYYKIYAKRFKGLTEEEAKYILEVQFEWAQKRKPDIDNPQTFSEKLQWMKLYYHNPLQTLCADKVKVRDYIKEKIGEEYLVPLIGVYDSADDIDFSTLPDRFVMKVNWGSGQNIIVKDKSKLNIKDAKKRLKNWLKPESNHYYSGLEWVYKNIPPKIIIEEYLDSINNQALDYKVMCFNGKPYYFWISNKNLDVQERSFYDMDWNMQDMELVEPHKIKAKQPVPKPENFEKMKELATILCKGFPHVRVDFYQTSDGSIKFGELTFISASGYSPWAPEGVDKMLGDLIDIEQLKREIKECNY